MPIPFAPRRAALLAVLAAGLAAGCDSTPEVPYPVFRVTGAELRAAQRPDGTAIEAEAVTEIVDYEVLPQCTTPGVDCQQGVAQNQPLPDRTRLVADQPVRIGGQTVAAGSDLLAALGGPAREQLGLSPFAISSLPPDAVGFEAGRTQLTATWQMDDGLRITASATVAR